MHAGAKAAGLQEWGALQQQAGRPCLPAALAGSCAAVATAAAAQVTCPAVLLLRKLRGEACAKSSSQTAPTPTYAGCMSDSELMRRQQRLTMQPSGPQASAAGTGSCWGTGVTCRHGCTSLMLLAKCFQVYSWPCRSLQSQTAVLLARSHSCLASLWHRSC